MRNRDQEDIIKSMTPDVRYQNKEIVEVLCDIRDAINEMRSSEDEGNEIKRCEPDGISYPPILLPKSKCRRCGYTWAEGDEPPICHGSSEDKQEDEEEEVFIEIEINEKTEWGNGSWTSYLGTKKMTKSEARRLGLI